MIVLDTHIWIWWMNGDPRFTSAMERIVNEHQGEGIGISAISFWEVAQLVKRNRIAVSMDAETWIRTALSAPGVVPIDLSPAIAVESVNLPGQFHRDPADQMIVATARVLNCPLLTADARILAYAHVQLAAKA